jgi:ribosomal protein S18 acetylase RimI-like enzyme
MKNLEISFREIRSDDVAAIVEIDAIHSGNTKPDYWRERLAPFIEKTNSKRISIGYVAATSDADRSAVVGYILAEGRAWEFGSPLCGWILAIGVRPDAGRSGLGIGLCSAVCRRFKELDIRTVRTMVRKDHLELLSFFRAAGFRAGPFVEMELEL